MKAKTLRAMLGMWMGCVVGSALGDTVLEIKHADKWTYDAESGTQVLEGNVEVAYEGIQIQAARIRFNTSQGGKNLEQAFAEGAVRVQAEGRTARGEKAEYDFGKDTLRLSGNASVTQGKNVIQAREIQFTRASSAMTAVGGVSGSFAGASGGGEKALTLERAGKWVFDPSRHQHDLTGDPVVVMEDTRISASRILLQMDQEDKTIVRADSEAPVEIVRDDLRASANSATFFPAGDSEESLVLNGNARLYQGANFMSGDEIVFFPKSGDMRGKNVHVTIQVEGETGGMP